MIDLGVKDPDWLEGGAACLNSWDLFSPPEREHWEPKETDEAARHRVADALAICAACPMLDACRAWAFDNRNRLSGSVVAGMDLSNVENYDMTKPDALDVDIYRQRLDVLITGLGWELTEYQRFYLDQIIQGIDEKWATSGSRGPAVRAQCEHLLDHPDLGLRRSRGDVKAG